MCWMKNDKKERNMAKKLTKAERKALNAKKKAQDDDSNKTTDVAERDLGYDADFYVNADGEEVESVRSDFVVKPEWYKRMFRNGQIRYTTNELQVQCNDGTWHAGRDVKCSLVRFADEKVMIIGEEELKKNWKRVATTSSRLVKK